MSLNREQWEEMWNDIKFIEEKLLKNPDIRIAAKSLMLNKVYKTKEKIQLVIGQME